MLRGGDFVKSLDVDVTVLREFERGLDPQHPERSRVPASVLGYGEISTVFEIRLEGLRDLAFKRLPIFFTEQEIVRYQSAYEEYCRLLREDVGLQLPAYGYAAFVTDTGRPMFYIIQQKLAHDSIGNRALRLLPREDILELVRRILRELQKVWEFNQRQQDIRLAVDGQISNWSIDGFDAQASRLPEDAVLRYLDTSTPLFRIQGEEQIDPEWFLRSGPSFLMWVLRLLFLKDVVDRYYDFHRVAVDLVANFYKEQRPELIPGLVGVVNDFVEGEAASLRVQPLTEQEVKSYYREDALIWRLYLAMRKVDRFLRTRILHREYPYILPSEIKR
jgi:hypothetical protein